MGFYQLDLFCMTALIEYVRVITMIKSKKVIDYLTISNPIKLKELV